MSKTLRYRTREGVTWLLHECVPLPHAPGFWIGWKKGRHDREQRVVHEHRVVEVVESKGGETRSVESERRGEQA